MGSIVFFELKWIGIYSFLEIGFIKSFNECVNNIEV